MNFGLYVVQLLLFPACHFMSFFKDFLGFFCCIYFFLIHISKIHFYCHAIDPDVQHTALISACM